MSRLLRLFLISVLLLFPGLAVTWGQTADFIIAPNTGCSPLLVNFTDNSTGAVTGYSWVFGNNVTSILQNPSTTYSAPGVYTVTLTVTGPGGTSSKTDHITIYDKPVISFTTAATSGCSPHTTQFFATVTPNSPGPVNYSWDFGDGYTSADSTPFHTYTTPGTYTVALTVTNSAGCSRTLANNAYITVYENPVGDFTASQRLFCGAPASVSFTNTSINGTPPYSATWLYGDGGNGSGNATTHNYTTGGAYTVSMTVTDANGCNNMNVKAAYITVNTVLPTFSGPTTLCFGDLAVFQNTTPGAIATNWKFGDGDSATGSIGTHFYATGTYTVTMTTEFNGCIKTTTKSITVNARPDVTLGLYPPIPCPAPSSINLQATRAMR